MFSFSLTVIFLYWREDMDSDQLNGPKFLNKLNDYNEAKGQSVVIGRSVENQSQRESS